MKSLEIKEFVIDTTMLLKIQRMNLQLGENQYEQKLANILKNQTQQHVNMIFQSQIRKLSLPNFLIHASDLILG